MNDYFNQTVSIALTREQWSLVERAIKELIAKESRYQNTETFRKRLGKIENTIFSERTK